jgi:hypothetical protein
VQGSLRSSKLHGLGRLKDFLALNNDFDTVKIADGYRSYDLTNSNKDLPHIAGYRAC